MTKISRAAFLDELEKISTAGLANEDTIHKRALKNSLKWGTMYGVGSTGAELAAHRIGGPLGKGAGRWAATKALKRSAGAAGGLLAIQEGGLLLSKKKRDAFRASLDAKHAAEKS